MHELPVGLGFGDFAFKLAPQLEVLPKLFFKIIAIRGHARIPHSAVSVTLGSVS